MEEKRRKIHRRFPAGAMLSIAMGGMFVVISIKSVLTFRGIFGLIVGLAMGAPAVFVMKGTIKRLLCWCREEMLLRRLVRQNRFVWARIIDWQYNEEVNTAGGHPYRLLASGMDQKGVTQTWLSDDTVDDLAITLVGDSVRVYVDDKSDFYYMDFKELLGK